MASTRVYPLKSDTFRVSEALVSRALSWARRRPVEGLLGAVLFTLAAAVLDVRLGPATHVDVLYLAAAALGGVSLQRPVPLLLTAVSAGLHFWVGLRRQIPGGVPASHWTSEALFLGALLLTVSAAAVLRRSLVRDAQHARILDGMRVVSTAIASSLDLGQVLHTTATQAQRLTRAGAVGIWLLDRDRSELTLAVCAARTPDQRVRADATRVSLDGGHALARSLAQPAIVMVESRRGNPLSESVCIAGVRGVCILPLISRGVAVGVMAAGLHSPRDPDALQVLRELATDAAIAIDHARLYAEAHRSLDAVEAMRVQAEASATRASFLAGAGRLFSATLDLRAAMETVVSKATEAFGDVCVIGLVDPGSDTLRVAAGHARITVARSLHDYLKSHPVRVGDGLIGAPAVDGRPRLARMDLGGAEELGEYARELGIQAILSVPLRRRGRLMGVLVAAYYEGARLPTHDDLQLAMLLGDRASIAIENAELFAETESAREALEIWNQELERRVAEKTRELESAQQGLLRSERLASIGRLAATIAHELRNPLNVIRVSHYTLARSSETERERKHLDAIERQVSAASRIIEALLDFAREAPPRFTPVDLNALVPQVLSDANVPAAITVAQTLDPGVPAVQADPVQVGQILLNLVGNAVQAMASGGTLAVRTFTEGARVCVSVRDSGPGIPEEVRPRLFEPLFTTKTKGTGLGLATAQRIAEAHRGEIRVGSTPGAGATFTLALPLPDGQESARDVET